YQTISPRPFTNKSYILGKLLGFIGVMLSMDYFFMLMLFVSSLLLPNMSASVWPYLLYPIIITFPLCIFLFGSNVLAAQIFYPLVYFIPFVVVIYLLPLADIESARHLDLGAITLPLAYSAITGFTIITPQTSNVTFLLIQRMIFVLIGIGFVFGASLIMNFRRRGDKSWDIIQVYENIMKPILRFLFLGFIFLCAAICIYVIKIEPMDKIRMRKGPISNSKDIPPLLINSCDIKVIHKSSILDIHTRLNITNPNDSSLERLYFKHNFALKPYDITSGNRIKGFGRNYDQITISLNTPLEPNESMDLEISEYGPIHEWDGYFHIPENMLDRIHRSGLTTLGKQTLLLEPDYVLLPAEMSWYPTSNSKYQASEPGYVQCPLTDFSLEVQTHDGLTVISQGEMTDKGDNTYYFKPETPLTQISLTIGRYQKASITVDDVEYSYYWIGKNPFADSKITKKELEQSIRQTKEEIEQTLHLKYPFKRYQIVETPIHFFGYNSAVDMSSPYEQPEIKFIPESSLKLDYGPRMGPPSAVLTRIVFPKLYTTDTNARAISNKMNLPSSIFNLGGLWSFTTNPFINYSHILSQYAYFTRGPVSVNDYFNLMAVNWLRSKFFFHAGFHGGLIDLFYKNVNNAQSQFFTKKSLKDILAEEQYYSESMDILNMASKTYFNLLAGKSGIDITRLENILLEGFSQNGIDVAAKLSELCGTDVIALLEDFSEQKEKAHYNLTNIKTSKHLINDRYLHNARFNVSNPTPYHGLVTCTLVAESLELDTKAVYLEPFTEKEIGLVVSDKIRNLHYEWLPFGDKDRRNYDTDNPYNWPVSFHLSETDDIAFFDGIRVVRQGTVPVSVVVDNLDEGCRIVSSKKKKFIQRFTENRKENASYKKFINFKGLDDAPSEWSHAKSRGESQGMNEFYGNYSSCYYTLAGDGQSAVEFQASIPEAGRYELYLRIPFGSGLQMYITPLFKSGALGETNVRVFADDGIHEETAYINNAGEEWAYVGTYSFPDTTAVIHITDKTNAKIVIADAIKLRKVE
ncbi:hypothetical protein ACFL50_07000, partial [Candidatus Latescibacterota bacterium]